MRAYERLLKYVSVYTTSDPDSATVPSSMRQYDLANILVDELKALGLENVHVDENGVVYGWLSATAGCEQKPALGFIAHLDTAPDCSGENVKPQIIEHYDGGDVLLAGSGETLSPAAFPGLKKLVGMTLITTDGTTLLGADCAYTLDGGEEGEIAYETFNACSAELHFDGLSVHPGSSKDTMINAALVAMEYNALLPAGDIPRLTEGYEGFFHLCDMKGDVEHAELHYIVRDHDRATFEARKKLMEHAVKVINEKYGRSVVTLRLKDSYYNMAEKLTDHMELIENAKRACEAAGMKPFIEAVRGGTDGCRLSYMGLPTPNLCTGGFAFHGPYEHIAAESMDRCTKMVELLMIGE